MDNLNHFHYSNVQKHQHGGRKTLHKVVIKKGKGYKSVTHYRKGKISKTIKKPIHSDHVLLIYQKKFIPGLFSDCTSQNKTKKRKHIK